MTCVETWGWRVTATITRNNEPLVLVEMCNEMGAFRLRRKTLQWSDRWSMEKTRVESWDWLGAEAEVLSRLIGYKGSELRLTQVSWFPSRLDNGVQTCQRYVLKRRGGGGGGGSDVASGDVVSFRFSSHRFQPKQGCPLSYFQHQKLVDRAVPCFSYLVQVKERQMQMRRRNRPACYTPSDPCWHPHRHPFWSLLTMRQWISQESWGE